jgi:oligoribonuclease NrnB/cAMP/cGMP phosphodiesterase (DHH superfamily)
MDETLIDTDRLPLSRKSLLPGAGFFTPDEEGLDPERVAALERAEAVVVADGDADGLGCAALVRERYDDPLPELAAPGEGVEPPTGRVALLPSAPHRIADSLEAVLEHTPEGVAVYVCDLCPDGEADLAPLAELSEHAGEMRWFDHHQWEPSLADAVRTAGVDLTVGDSDEECSTDVAYRELGDVDARFAELAAVTRDHDLWIREDPRSDDLADYAHWTDSETYVATVRTGGADLPDAAREYLAERRVEKERLIDLAVGRAETHDVDGATVAVTYGRCSQNEVAERLREDGADAVAVVKPAGSASIRGTDGFERCHEVAAALGGGGHPKAAGCKPDIYDDMLDYAVHWTSRGAVAKRVILDAFRGLEPEDEAEPAGDD